MMGHNICLKGLIWKFIPYLSNFYAPNFREVEGAYWFGPVRPSVRPSVRLSVSPSVRLSVCP